MGAKIVLGRVGKGSNVVCVYYEKFMKKNAK